MEWRHEKEDTAYGYVNGHGNGGNRACYFYLHADRIAVADLLDKMTEQSDWDWWTEGGTIVLEAKDPMFQGGLRDYDAEAPAVLAAVLRDLVSPPEPEQWVLNLYISTAEGEGLGALRRIRLIKANVPPGFSFRLPACPVRVDSGVKELQSGELLVVVHSYNARGRFARRVILFVTARNIAGGGWVTYVAKREGGAWVPRYCGLFDP